MKESSFRILSVFKEGAEFCDFSMVS